MFAGQETLRYDYTWFSVQPTTEQDLSFALTNEGGGEGCDVVRHPEHVGSGSTPT